MARFQLSLRTFRKQTQAVAIIEFALILPLLIIVLWGVVEASRFVIINQKLVKATSTMADLVTQGDTLCVSGNQMSTVFYQAAQQVMKPFEAGNSNFSAIFTSAASTTLMGLPPPCTGSTGESCITWQETQGAGAVSPTGNPGDTATLPQGSTISTGQNVLVVETFYNYSPMLPTTAVFAPMFRARTIYSVAVFKPRAGDLIAGCNTPPSS